MDNLEPGSPASPSPKKVNKTEQSPEPVAKALSTTASKQVIEEE
jgi:hypothetical protein